MSIKESVKGAKFIKSASDPSHFPPAHRPEIAVIGRSNVGKSSLLNFIFQVKGLVKTSSEPGKTRLINFFESAGLVFVDLPGWGYAKASKQEKIVWSELIETYLVKREELKVVLYLLDIRREPTQEDADMVEWLRARGKKIIFVITKADKANQSELIKQTRLLAGFFQENPVTTSSKEGKGREHLLKTIHEALSGALKHG